MAFMGENRNFIARFLKTNVLGCLIMDKIIIVSTGLANSFFVLVCACACVRNAY